MCSQGDEHAFSIGFRSVKEAFIALGTVDWPGFRVRSTLAIAVLSLALTTLPGPTSPGSLLTAIRGSSLAGQRFRVGGGAVLDGRDRRLS